MENGRRQTTRKRPINSYYTNSEQNSQRVNFSNWPYREKVALLKALKKYGHYDMVNVCKAVPGKSKDQIKAAIDMWWKAARVAMLASAGDKQSRDGLKHVPKRGKGRPSGSSKGFSTEKAPIDQWLHKLEESQPACSCSETKLLQKALLYISKYENHPSPQKCNGVDYRAMYEYLYCMLSGYPGKTLNPETAAYVLDSLNDLALEIRERGMQKETFFLDVVQRIYGQLRQYAGKTKTESDLEPTSPEAAFKNFMKTVGVNPLNIPMSLLKK
ncbi:hypothetical protein B7P43_G11722 [Cryptotermes secundus]|uniref:Uncharacterized protein n=1 Tax=Cryptotermes secundus TaxID=105785 RepID=A0A2J7PUB0_9NEOP|nr:uncharacterized protein LOC111871775 [Cryptotermes secundus]PNF19919.1 hypothetical protein B7P43_G11722 [Cryptotermes secundus]